jgi:hypothetical protein
MTNEELKPCPFCGVVCTYVSNFSSRRCIVTDEITRQYNAILTGEGVSN